MQELLKEDYRTEVEMFCSACPGRLASVFGENVGISAGTASVTGGHRALVWTSPPKEDCGCLANATDGKFAPSPSHSATVLDAMKQVTQKGLRQKMRSIGGRATVHAMAGMWAGKEPQAGAAAAARVLSFAEEAVRGLSATEDTLDSFSSALDELGDD